MPYSPYLSIQYNTYINIEVALNIDIFKYLYKYIYKGPDRIVAVIDRKIIDKIKDYINARQLGILESIQYLFTFFIAKHLLPIISL